jgi:glycosyltransferase involved in cell wall biosynthesis
VKVCYLLDTVVGATWALEQLRDLRDKYGYEVTAIICDNQGELVDKLRAEKIPFHVRTFGFTSVINVWTVPLKVIRLARLLRRERFDVVQTHLFHSMFVGRLAAWLADVPVRLTMVAGPFHLEAHTLRWLDRSTCWMETAVIASCEYTRHLYSLMGVPDEKLELIYYGPDERKFNPEELPPADIRKEYGWPPETPLIGMVAYFYPPWRRSGLTPPGIHGRGIKGHEYLIRAAPAVLDEFPATRLLLIGSALREDGARHKDDLERLARSLGLQDRVVFTGFRSDVNRVLRSLDVAVQPSLNENLGGTIESLLMECPLVASRVGGMVDSVRDGETGILVEPANPEALAQGILQLLRAPERARRLGRAGRKLMLERFTLSRTVHDLSELYRRRLQSQGDAQQKYRRGVSCYRLVVLVFVCTLVGLWLLPQLFILRLWDEIRDLKDSYVQRREMNTSGKLSR